MMRTYSALIAAMPKPLKMQKSKTIVFSPGANPPIMNVVRAEMIMETAVDRKCMLDEHAQYREFQHLTTSPKMICDPMALMSKRPRTIPATPESAIYRVSK